MQADTGVWHGKDREATSHNVYVSPHNKPQWLVKFIGPQARAEAIAFAQAVVVKPGVVCCTVYGPTQGYGGPNVWQACGNRATHGQRDWVAGHGNN